MMNFFRGRSSCSLIACVCLALIGLEIRIVESFQIGTVLPGAAVRKLQAGGGWVRSRPSSSCIKLQEAGGSNSDDDSHEKTTIPTEWRGEVLKKLKTIIDPDLGSDIVTLGFVQNLRLDTEERIVSFDVELTTPACPVKDQFAADCERLVSELPWTNSINVTMTAQQVAVQDTNTVGMAQVGAVIAVSSCKGGVGKSTTAVNLAFALQSLGATVGIFDADFYGPSLPTMVQPDDDTVRFVGRQIAPLQRNGVRLMSFGYVNEGSAVMRGPMVTQMLDQFMAVTHWGALDYLILDLPPGTGDIQLTLTQRLNITAAVIVTTPQELSFADVVRGIEMFDSVNVPAVAVVENMAYLENTKSSKTSLDTVALKEALLQKLASVDNLKPNNGEDERASTELIDTLAEDLVQVVLEQQGADENGKEAEDEKVYIFGSGHKHRLAEQWGIEHTFSVPLLGRIASNGDSGTPFVLEHPDSPQAAIYKELASAVVKEVAKTKYQQDTRPIFEFNEEENALEWIQQKTQSQNDNNKKDDGEEEKQTERVVVQRLAPAELRKACRCAACVEEMTGRQLLDVRSIPNTVRPLRMQPTGNYALSVDWSDGHRSLYPYKQIKALTEESSPTKDDDAQSKKTATTSAPAAEPAFASR